MIGEVSAFLASGCVFGLTGGFSPGPTSALVIAQSVRYGPGEGIKVALAPLLTDAPIITVAVLLVGQLARVEPLLGGVTLCGAGFLVYLAIESFRVRGLEVHVADVAPHSLRRGFVVNLLNPHPYLFWFVVGAPTLLKATDVHPIAAILFVAGLYACLIGTKLLIAILAARARVFLNSRAYLVVNRLLGAAMAAFALLFLRDGLRYLGLI